MNEIQAINELGVTLDNIRNYVFNTILRAFTPASDIAAGSRSNQIIWGRDGNDYLIGFIPGADDPNRQQIDVLLGDLEELEPATPRDWNNKFILGDWRQPYYVDTDPSNLGFNQFAITFDFNPSLDTIQLYGNPSDYQLITTPFGSAIYFQQTNAQPDLIATLLGDYVTSLEDPYFQYVNALPEGPVLEQVQQLGTSGFDIALGIAVDGAGEIYTTGATTSELGGSYAGVRDVWTARYDNIGNQLQIQQFGTPNFDLSTDIVADKQGNFYLTGATEGNLAAPNQGARDAWVAKFDSNGNKLWIQQFGTELIDSSFSIDVDNDGNVYLSGLTLKPSENQSLDPTDDYQDDSWVTKYDANGNQLWFTEFGTFEYDEAYGVAVDNNSNVYATGWTLGDLGGLNAGLYDAWLSKTNNDGQLLWIQQFGTSDYDWSWATDTDSQGNVYATGWTLGSLGGDNAGSYDTWLAKFDSDGNQLWTRQFGTTGDDATYFGAVTIDSNDNIFLTGYTNGDLGGDNSGSYDAWVARFDSEGKRLWIQQFGSSELDYASDVAVDNVGNLYMTGFTEGSLGSASAGSIDTWIAKLDAESGALLNFSGNSQNDTLITRCPTTNDVSAEDQEIASTDVDPINTTTLTGLTTILMGATVLTTSEAAINTLWADSPFSVSSSLSPNLNFENNNIVVEAF